MTAFDFSKIAYPAWMDIAQCLYERQEQWAEAGSPAHSFATMLPGFRTCLYCGKPEDSVAHRVGALAATYGPRPVAASIRAAVAKRHGAQPASLAGVIAGLGHLAEQVAGIRLDADTVVIAGEKYVRRPF